MYKQGYLVKHGIRHVEGIRSVEVDLPAETSNIIIIVCRCAIGQTQMQESGSVDPSDQFALIDLVELPMDLSSICR